MRDAARRRARRKGAREDRRCESRTNLYDEVTARIISELEAGRLPWVQPWGTTASAGPSLPRNALTARAYSGVNVLILWGAVIEPGWPSQSWLTFRQAQEAGGCVRKGERGQCVVYADRFNRAIFRAASAATKAAEWLLARHREARGAQEDGRIAA